jgi:FkbM family methyltransferase
MARKTKIIEGLRSSLGDRTTSWLLAVRYYWLLHTIRANEVDMSLIPHLVQEGDFVIDVGANSADWTWRLSKQVGNSGRVLAFEADPYYAEVTRKVISLLRLKNVTFFPYGLSDKAMNAPLQIRTPDNERVVGTGHIVTDQHARAVEKGQTVQVKLMPLDEIPELKPVIGAIRLIKCDVEGHELNVFHGALKTLNQSRPVVITEVGHAEYHADNKQDIFSFFQELNYNCYVIGPDNHSLLPSNVGDEFPSEIRPNRIMIPEENDRWF